MPIPTPWIAAALLPLSCGVFAAQNTCSTASGPAVTPVMELYTSEGCSSCPPADKWLSSLKSSGMVVQAFHVGYWDYIGWVDRFAAPAHTQRQRDIAAANGLRSIYTPQLVRDGRDWRDYPRAFTSARTTEPAAASLRIERVAADAVEAEVVPAAAGQPWTAYWTVTEHAHSSKVKAGENAGELLQHDFVVRQYVLAGQYQGTQKLRLRPVAAQPSHAQQVNLVVLDARSGKPWQALSLQCPAAS